MVNPARVSNFLDFAGSWDPTLMFVMAGGLVVTTLGYAFIFRRSSPLVDEKFHLPTQRQIDLPLVGGAALFGVGWGLAGILPRPCARRSCDFRPKSSGVCYGHAGRNDCSECLAIQGVCDESSASSVGLRSLLD